MDKNSPQSYRAGIDSWIQYIASDTKSAVGELLEPYIYHSGDDQSDTAINALLEANREHLALCIRDATERILVDALAKDLLDEIDYLAFTSMAFEVASSPGALLTYFLRAIEEHKGDIVTDIRNIVWENEGENT